MPKEKPPAPSVMISARDLKDIIRDELYALQVQLGRGLPNELVKEIAKTIVNRALLSPR